MDGGCHKSTISYIELQEDGLAGATPNARSSDRSSADLTHHNIIPSAVVNTEETAISLENDVEHGVGQTYQKFGKGKWNNRSLLTQIICLMPVGLIVVAFIISRILFNPTSTKFKISPG